MEMKSKIYPAIYKDTGKAIYLYFDADNYYCFGRDMWDKTYDEDDHGNDINITPEYLANTYGKVESKEHAEFIVDLGDINNLSSRTGYTEEHPSWFCFNDDDELFFFDNESDANDNGEKLITIPLPPKQIQTATSEEEFEMQQIMKNNGDNLVLGCEDSKCEEWPCVGDEVVFTDLLQHYDQYKDDYCNKTSKVIARFKSSQGEFITVHREYCAVMTVRVDRILQDGALVKPKTPEEELRDDIKKAVYLVSEGEEDSLHITSILSKYNITRAKY